MPDNLIDVSHEVFGKYINCTKYGKYYYADSDFTAGDGIGRPVFGAVSDCGHKFGWWDWLRGY